MKGNRTKHNNINIANYKTISTSKTKIMAVTKNKSDNTTTTSASCHVSNLLRNNSSKQ